MAALIIAVASIPIARTHANTDFPFKVMPIVLPMLAVAFVNLELGVWFWILLSAVGIHLGADLPGLPPMYFTQFMLLMLLVVGMGRFAIHGAKRARLATSKVALPLLLLLVWGGVCIVGSRALYTTSDTRMLRRGIASNLFLYSNSLLYQLHGLILLIMNFMMYLLLMNVSRQERWRRRFLWAIILAGVPVLAYQFYLFVVEAQGEIGYATQVYSTLTGGFLATYYLIALLLLLALVSIVFKGIYRLILSLYAVLIAMGIVIAFSRAMLIAATVAVGLFMLVSTKKIWRGLVNIALFGLIIAALTGWLFAYVENATVKFGVEQAVKTSGSHRLELASDALRIWQEHPLFGIGFQNYRLFSTVMYRNERYGMIPRNSPHNEWLGILVDEGPLGPILLAWFLVSALREGWLVWRSAKNDFDQVLGLALVCALAGLMVGQLAGDMILGDFDNGGYQIMSARMYFWVLLGIVSAAKRQEAIENTGPNDEGVATKAL